MRLPRTWDFDANTLNRISHVPPAIYINVIITTRLTIFWDNRSHEFDLTLFEDQSADESTR